jgi:two-component system sensor histidine kinase BaeS
MLRHFLGSVAGRFALAAMACVLLAVGIIAIGVMLVGGDLLVHLLMVAGEEAAAARAMFDDSIGPVVLVAAAGALLAATALAVLVGRTLSRPIRRLDDAAHRISSGDLDARVPTDGPTELSGLAESFNRMAESLSEQEHLRRDFVANAAHELRTPLTNLKGYLEALRDGVIEPDRATFVSLMEEAERLVRLSRSLDTLAEGDAGGPLAQLEAVDLALAVRSSVELARPSFEQLGLSLTLDVPASLMAHANPDHLAQVLGNLLQNALRYSSAGGQVAVRALRSGDVAMVVVSNTGESIPAADLPRVFERFYRVEKSRDRAQGGAGIGLAIVRELVEGDGGEVGVESREGQTRFWFSLPAASS